MAVMVWWRVKKHTHAAARSRDSRREKEEDGGQGNVSQRNLNFPLVEEASE